MSDGPRGGKGAVLMCRISKNMRARLEAEAVSERRTIGQIAERWLEQARENQARDQRDMLIVLGYGLLEVLEQQHKSMCPANTCTCDWRFDVAERMRELKVYLATMPRNVWEA